MRFKKSLPVRLAARLSAIAGFEIQAPVRNLPHSHSAARIAATLARFQDYLGEKQGFRQPLVAPSFFASEEDVAKALVALSLATRIDGCAVEPPVFPDHLSVCYSSREHLVALLATLVSDLSYDDGQAAVNPRARAEEIFAVYRRASKRIAAAAQELPMVQINCDTEEVLMVAETPAQRRCAGMAARKLMKIPAFVRQLSDDLAQRRLRRCAPLSDREYRRVVDQMISRSPIGTGIFAARSRAFIQ